MLLSAMIVQYEFWKYTAVFLDQHWAKYVAHSENTYYEASKLLQFLEIETWKSIKFP